MTHKTLLFLASFALITQTLFADDQPAAMPHQTMQAVPFTQVKIAADAPIWAQRLETNREISIPHNFAWCEKTGRFTNFAKAAGLQEGDFQGIYFNDSDVYKLLEGTAYCLQLHPDAELQKKADAVIDWIAAAQQPNGYINSYYQLREPDKKWTNTRVMHELYCGGHMAEAAVAYAQATGQTKLLDVTEKFMDHIMTVFGPEEGKRVEVPGHEEIELALVKLYQYTGKKKYFDLAEFFIDARGKQLKRTDTLQGPYSQDHKPVRQQAEPVGHAVRAMYLFAGMADVAAYTGDEDLKYALETLWNDVVNKKLYITGGVGARHEGEAFGDAFELPNKSAYCETCAGIGLAFWAHRMNLMTGEAKYADVVERALYNNILGGIGSDGKSFFYVNPLESTGHHHRQPFFDCACCPTNVVRFLPSLPGYVYAVTDVEPLIGDLDDLEEDAAEEADEEADEEEDAADEFGWMSINKTLPQKKEVYVNLFIPGTTTVDLGDSKVDVTIKTDYPWDGSIHITCRPHGEKEGITDEDIQNYLERMNKSSKEEDPLKTFTLRVRIPGWHVERGGGFSSYESDGGGGGSCGDGFFSRPEEESGAWYVSENMHARKSITIRLEMATVRMIANPHVTADRGRVAIQRGPLVYCFEQCDNEVPVDKIVLARDPEFKETFEKDLLGGVMVIKCKNADGRELTAVPYFAWDSREPGKMAVWVRQEGLTRNPYVGNTAWTDEETGEPILYRRLTDDMLTGDDSHLTFTETLTPSASFCSDKDSLEAMFGETAPKNSCDHSIPRMTFWPHKGSAEWVAVERDKRFKVSKCGVYWFDDTGRGECRIPESATLSYRAGDQWKPLDFQVGTAADTLNTVEFPEIETTGLRLNVQLKEGVSTGILQWKME